MSLGEVSSSTESPMAYLEVREDTDKGLLVSRGSEPTGRRSLEAPGPRYPPQSSPPGVAGEARETGEPTEPRPGVRGERTEWSEVEPRLPWGEPQPSSDPLLEPSAVLEEGGKDRPVGVIASPSSSNVVASISWGWW